MKQMKNIKQKTPGKKKKQQKKTFRVLILVLRG